MPKKFEKWTIKSRACVPLRARQGVTLTYSVGPRAYTWDFTILCEIFRSLNQQVDKGKPRGRKFRETVPVICLQWTKYAYIELKFVPNRTMALGGGGGDWLQVSVDLWLSRWQHPSPLRTHGRCRQVDKHTRELDSGQSVLSGTFMGTHGAIDRGSNMWFCKLSVSNFVLKGRVLWDE